MTWKSDPIARWLEGQTKRPYLVLGALLAAATALRALLEPVLGDHHPYSIYFPMVLLASYLFGVRAALVATAASALLGLALFADPFRSVEALRGAAAGVLLFGLNCGAVIYLVGALTRSMGELSLAQGRSEALAQTHAELFQEVNQRITHHLRLVAGVLALQAGGEPEPAVSAGLRKAAQRSLQISRAHAELGGAGGEPVAFNVVCRRIVQSLLAAQSEPADRVTVEAGEFSLPPEAATALAAALLECLVEVLKLRPAGPIAVRLTQSEHACAAEVTLADAGAADRLRGLARSFLLQAVIEQLGANLSLRRRDGHATLQVAFESEWAQQPAGPLLQETVH